MAKCPDCDSVAIFSIPERGNGKCSRCHGDGKSLSSGLNEAIFQTPLYCGNCGGPPGTCPTCGGTGEVEGSDYPEDSDKGSSSKRNARDEETTGEETGDHSSYSSGEHGGTGGGWSIGDIIAAPFAYVFISVVIYFLITAILEIYGIKPFIAGAIGMGIANTLFIGGIVAIVAEIIKKVSGASNKIWLGVLVIIGAYFLFVQLPVILQTKNTYENNNIEIPKAIQPDENLSTGRQTPADTTGSPPDVADKTPSDTDRATFVDPIAPNATPEGSDSYSTQTPSPASVPEMVESTTPSSATVIEKLDNTNPSYYIQSINARVAKINFFENDFNPTTSLHRNQYREHFNKSTSKYIFWEIVLDYPPPTGRIDYDIESIWYDMNNNKIYRNTSNFYIIPKTWQSYNYDGYGRRIPGNFEVGKYRVELLSQGEKIAVGTFEIH